MREVVNKELETIVTSLDVGNAESNNSSIENWTTFKFPYTLKLNDI